MARLINWLSDLARTWPLIGPAFEKSLGAVTLKDLDHMVGPVEPRTAAPTRAVRSDMSFGQRARRWSARYSRLVAAACYGIVVGIDFPIEYSGYMYANPVFSLLMLLAAPTWIVLAIATIPLSFAINSGETRTILLLVNLGLGCAVNFAFLLGVRIRKNERGNRRLVLAK